MSQKSHRSDQDFNEEIQSHIEIEADRLVEQGMDRQEAIAAARRTFGNVAKTQERFYESNRWMWLDQLGRSFRHVVRELQRSPVATATIILSLTVGIGAATAIFSLTDQALLRALPITEPERLVQLEWNGRFVGNGMGSIGAGSLIPYPLYRQLREENEVFEGMLARAPARVHLAIGDDSEPAGVELVTGSYFTTLGVRPALGRLLTEADNLTEDAHPVAVLSHDYWQSRLGGDPAIVGSTVRINGYPMTVVGVAEAGFRGMDWINPPALFVPMMMKSRATPPWSGLRESRARFSHVFGRLKPGISREQAEAGLQPWFKAYLAVDTKSEGWPLLTEQQLSEYLGSTLDLLPGGQGDTFLKGYLFEKPMLILLAATSLILLLTCLNVANLSLARVLARRRATALRTALGASRRHILTEQLIESATLAAGGCLAGSLLAPTLSRVLLSFMPRFGTTAPALTADLDVRVLGFALGITALATLLSGTAPALFAASVRPMTAIKEQAASIAGGIGFRKALVVGQFALALILLIGAGLLARTLGSLRAEGPGYSTANLLMFRLSPVNDGYSVEQTKPLVRKVLAELETLPDVENAGVARMGMLGVSRWGNPVTLVSDERIVTENVQMEAITPGLFQTLGSPITRGRDFTERDGREDSRWELRTAIVNEEFVKRYLPSGDPVGVRVGIGGRPETVAGAEIVGVVRTFHNSRLREPEPLIFFSLWEIGVKDGTFYVRSRSSTDSAARSIRAAVNRVDSALTVFELRTIDDQLDRLLFIERMLATLAGAFAVVATFLAMIGLYGVLSFSAARRAKEIGIRLALGSPRWAAGGLIVREAATLAAIGIAIALPVSWLLGRLIESQLFGVRPIDAITSLGAAGVLALVCLVASAGPARKAGAVNPLDTLRSE
jgi:putative ABC transport system permease protein